MARFCLHKPSPSHHDAEASGRVTGEPEAPARRRALETKGPPHRGGAACACAARVRPLRLRKASPAPLRFRSPPARAEWASGPQPPAGGWRFLTSASASDSPSLGKKPSAWARAGGASGASAGSGDPAGLGLFPWRRHLLP